MAQPATVKTRHFVTFRIRGELYGIDIRLIGEVNPNINIIPIPLSDKHIKGHINIRGQVVLIIDVMQIFGKEEKPLPPTAHTIIFKTAQDLLRIRGLDRRIRLEDFPNKPVGIVIDEIGDVLAVEVERIELPTQYLTSNYSPFLEGIVKLKDDLLIVLLPEKIINYNPGSKEAVYEQK